MPDCGPHRYADADHSTIRCDAHGSFIPACPGNRHYDALDLSQVLPFAPEEPHEHQPADPPAASGAPVDDPDADMASDGGDDGGAVSEVGVGEIVTEAREVFPAGTLIERDERARLIEELSRTANAMAKERAEARLETVRNIDMRTINNARIMGLITDAMADAEALYYAATSYGDRVLAFARSIQDSFAGKTLDELREYDLANANWPG